MKITNTALTVAVGFLLVGGAASAQTPEHSAEKIAEMQIAMLRKDLRDQAKQIVAANVPLTGDDAAKFWPMYDAYAQEVTKVYDQRLALVKAFAATYDNTTDASAASFIRSSIKIDETTSKLRLEWIPKFEKLIGEKKAAIFFQVDRRIGLMLELQLAAQVPLLQP